MDYAEALNNADARGVLKGRREGGCDSAVGHGETGGRELVRKEGIAGRAGDFARRVIVKLSSIYFTNLHTTSAVVAAARRGYRRGAARRVSST